MNGTGFVQMNVRFKVQLDLLSKQRYLFDLWQGGVGGAEDMSTRHSMLCPLNSAEHMKVMGSRFNRE